MMKKPFTFSAQGFTLIETLVAISILTVAIAGPMFTAQVSITASRSSQDELTASSLAQEGLEYVRARRDDNMLTSQSWLSGLDACFATNGCTIDATNTTSGGVAACTGICPVLYISAAYLYNQQQSGTPTVFTRTVHITIVDDHTAIVSVTVSWTSAHQSRFVNVQETLENWL